MAGKTANINIRVEKSVKEQAEAILDNLGISASTFINMAYRQVIMKNGVPFDVTIPSGFLVRENMSSQEYNDMMNKGLSQAKNDEAVELEEAFDSLLKGL